MIGVAIPGIAPLAASAPADGRAAAPDAAPVLQSQQRTMLGVAIPGIAPTHDPARAMGASAHHAPAHAPAPAHPAHAVPGHSPLVPAPAPLHEEPLPEPPRVPARRGVSAVAVVGIVFVLVAALGGAAAYVATRSSHALTATAQLDETGREALQIGCASCPDGTILALGASSATVAASAALLPLPAPLAIGDNDLVVTINRPGAGRDEDVKVRVPVAYRVKADLTTLSARPPAITVRVESKPGAEVKVQDAVVPLDANGRGAYVIDLTEQTTGTGEATTFERSIPFSITQDGKSESGTLVARTGVLGLALDAPGARLMTDKDAASVAGQTRPNATVTVDGQPTPVDTSGRFARRVPLPASGEKEIVVDVSAPSFAPRIAKARVVRVASLAAGAAQLETESPLTYAAFSADAAASIGKLAVVEGEVVTVRDDAGHSVFVVEDRRACPRDASCPVRIVHGDDATFARGDTVRAYGRVVGTVRANGKVIPDLESSLVMVTKAARR